DAEFLRQCLTVLTRRISLSDYLFLFLCEWRTLLPASRHAIRKQTRCNPFHLAQTLHQSCWFNFVCAGIRWNIPIAKRPGFSPCLLILQAAEVVKPLHQVFFEILGHRAAPLALDEIRINYAVAVRTAMPPKAWWRPIFYMGLPHPLRVSNPSSRHWFYRLTRSPR